MLTCNQGNTLVLILISRKISNQVLGNFSTMMEMITVNKMAIRALAIMVAWEWRTLEVKATPILAARRVPMIMTRILMKKIGTMRMSWTIQFLKHNKGSFCSRLRGNFKKWNGFRGKMRT